MAPRPAATPTNNGLSSSESLVDAISTASTTAALAEALREVEQWQWTSDQEAGMKRCKTYVPEQPALAAFYVSSVNEWKLLQPRVLVLTPSSYFRVKYDQKSGKVEHYRKTPLRDVLSLEKTADGLKIYLRGQDGRAGPQKWYQRLERKVAQISTGSKDNAFSGRVKDEFYYAREYRPSLPAGAPLSADQVTDVLAAALHKTAELHRDSLPADGAPFEPPPVLTTDERRQILHDRKAAARAEEERAEREAAEAELRHAVEAASACRELEPKTNQQLLDPSSQLIQVASASRELEPKTSSQINSAVLSRPIKRARRAVEADASLISRAEQLKAELEEEHRVRVEAERLERERTEREAATAELEAACTQAAASRDATSLSRSLKRARRAVDVSEELLGRGEALKAEIEAEIKAAREAAEEAERERKRAEREERERVERDAATAELEAAVGAAATSRDLVWLSKARARARRAVGVSAELMERADNLKTEIDLEKKLAAEEQRNHGR